MVALDKKETFLAAMEEGLDCESEWVWSWKIYLFSCGLSISRDFVQTPHSEGKKEKQAAVDAHQRHHIEEHTAHNGDNPWEIKGEWTDDDTVVCYCPGFGIAKTTGSQLPESLRDKLTALEEKHGALVSYLTKDEAEILEELIEEQDRNGYEEEIDYEDVPEDVLAEVLEDQSAKPHQHRYMSNQIGSPCRDKSCTGSRVRARKAKKTRR